MQRIKRLIIINLILIILILKLPVYENKPEELSINVEEQIVEQEVTISSRSLTEPRNVEQIVEQNIIEVTTISQNCINLIKKYEGLKLIAYLNKGEQYYTIGYGHHGSDVKANQTITTEQAEQLLIADLQGYSDYVLKYCEYLDLTQNELDALVSFAYNTGLGNLQKLTNNKTRTKEEIAEYFLKYVNKGSIYEKGLTKRRTEEKKLFLGGM